jgi:amidase
LKTVSCHEVTYVFARTIPPVLTVEQGDEVVFETLDARGGRAMDPREKYVPPPPQPVERTNPVTGPVSVQGAKPGDTLVVEVKRITLGSWGYVSARPTIGVLKDRVKSPMAKAIRVENAVIHFTESLRFPARPMVGTIGVAPQGDNVPSFYPGLHGGNMDCNDVVPGSKLYLPIFADGALFALGDVHASMGDGEISGGGLDISANVNVKLELIKNWTPRRPIVETSTHLSIVYNAGNLQDAVRGVVAETVELLSSKLGLSAEDAIALISTAGDVRICQACEGPVDVVVRLQMPRLFRLP